ncbi:MAG: hypothetical protein NT025_06365 [bacterium]|nr:hypothetical protein [bacterium]
MTTAEFQDLIRAARDPWIFLTRHVQTLDPERGVAHFPDWHYLHRLVGVACRERFLLVPKSRQMLVTWTMVALMVWRAMFRERGVLLFLSRNERCAEELLERARFILDHLPGYMRPRLSSNSKEEIAFRTLGSRLLSLPASPNGPRMYSPSSVFWDEMAFTPYDEPIWAALKPALDSGGRFVGVSSSGGANNLFARFVQGDRAAVGDRDSSLIPHPSSLFFVHRIHYSEHPERRNDRWKAQAALGLSQARWQQEQEISFESQSDQVYSEFDPQRHILGQDWGVRRDWEIFRAMDFGYRHPFVLWLQLTPENEVIVFDEWSEADRTTEELLQAVRNVDLVHGLTESDVTWTACDPAGAAAQDAGLSPVDLLRRAGMKLRYRSSRIAPGVERLKSALCDAAGRVHLRVAPRCRRLIADFARYRWAASGEEPLKDGQCDHSMDALRYFFVNLDSAREEMSIIPRLSGMRR